MEYNEMQNLIEAEVAEASEKLELLALHQELQMFFNQPNQTAFKDELRQRLMEEAERHRLRRRWKRFVFSAGSIAAALLIFALISPSVLDLKNANNLTTPQVTTAPENGNLAAGDIVYDKTGAADSIPSKPTPKVATTTPNRVETETLDQTVMPAVPPVQMDTVSPPGILMNGGGRFGTYSASSLEGTRGIPEAPGAVAQAPMLMKTITPTAAMPSDAVIYQERGREISSSEAAEIASLFGFREGRLIGGGYSYSNQENQSTLTIGNGVVPNTISFHRGVVNPGTGISLQTAINNARRLVAQIPCLEGDIGEPVRVRYNDSLSNTGSRQCIVVFERRLNGIRLLERSIMVTIDLGSGDTVGFTAAADVFEPQGSYPLIPQEEVVKSYGDSLQRLDLVLKSESYKNGVQLLTPRYLVTYNSQEGTRERLINAIQTGYY